MTERQIARRKAIIRRRIFLGACFAVLALVVALIIFIISAVTSYKNDTQNSSDILTSSISSDSSKPETSKVESSIETESSSKVSSSQTPADNNLDADFSCLLLVNGSNPLPDTYDSEVRASLVEIDKQYRNNDNVTQIHKDVYPYITAMVAAAQADGVGLKVWSPFRSYAIQKDLFQKQLP